MAQDLKSINLVAPGFKGINTEESPLSIDPNFAAIADNCVIDRYGRIAARKGYTALTTTKTSLGDAAVEVIEVFRDDAGNEVIFSAGNNKIMTGTTTLTDVTPAAYVITANNWDVVNFNNSIYFFQRGYMPLVYSNADGIQLMSAVAGYAGTAPQGNVVLGAWGKLWVADFTADKSTVYWSDTLIGHVWTGGTSGSIDISNVWPDGYDEIVNITAYNNQLIIFGKHSIVVYEGADTPSTMVLLDTISGVGLRDRNGVVDIGTDILFLAYDGVRSFGRTIQEKSMPLNDLSRNIKQDLLQVAAEETQPLRMVYSPENSFVLLVFRSQQLVYCFDVRGTLENNSYRVTRWPTNNIKALHRSSDGVLYIGTTDGICVYDGYNDNTATYFMRYYSPNLTFGDSSRLKILKKIRPTLIGGSGNLIRFKWGYGFSGKFSTYSGILFSSSIGEYGLSEFGVAEYADGTVATQFSINATGNGSSVVVGLEVEIDGSAVSLQEYNIWSMVGKLV